MLEYIEENLDRIIGKPENIMYLKPYSIGNKRALFAIVKKEQGVYEKVQISKEQYKMNFPFEPIYWFYQGPGYFFLKDFIDFHNWIDLNINHLDGFKYVILNERKLFNVGIFATFNDGSCTFIERKTKKEFEKNGGIQSYIDLLKPYKEYQPTFDSYEIIENYAINDENFVIPNLQQKNDEIKGPILAKRRKTINTDNK